MQQDRVFGAAVRRRYNLLLTVATFGLALLPFVLGLLALATVWPRERDEWSGLVVAAALGLAALGPWLAHNHLGLAGNGRLRARLWKRMRGRFADSPPGIEPVFVGFSPGDELVSWDGDTDQDVGFLVAWDETLLYYGDAFCWHLPRERIDQIEMSESAPGMTRITVRWHAPREIGRSFTFVSREARNLRQAQRATTALLKQLQAWRALDIDGAETDAPHLGLPPSDASGGLAADHLPSGSCVVSIALMALATLVTWRVVAPMVHAEHFQYAILWSGAILVLAALVINVVLRTLQWAEHEDADADN